MGRKKHHVWTWENALLLVFGVIIFVILFFAMFDQEVEVQKNISEQSSQSEISDKRGKWIYKGTYAGNDIAQTDKEYLDQIVEKWLGGLLTDDELADWMTQHLRDCEADTRTIGVMSRQMCLFESEADIPDYEARLRENGGIYEFIGLYTEGMRTENGKLICYYWEAGIR